ncbi:hypothetical protein THAOC_16333 [Thalassiosira oceanica]|uniref:F-box domain-containing protein n=1 Tax=Thalassiosira oceanica TaxID=159749 RepID=K0SA44_THAOC|nr:hypothetical protein THAOC_16333 [Thalassiosira oceanica]|eukprot:EJK63028.1 hypothetical protein THAOC_16333 [Thalassiosira oceanica]
MSTIPEDDDSSSGENTELNRKVEGPTSDDARLKRMVVSLHEGRRNDERAISPTARSARKSESTEQDGDESPLPTVTAQKTVDISSFDRDLVFGILSILGSGDLVNVGLQSATRRFRDTAWTRTWKTMTPRPRTVVRCCSPPARVQAQEQTCRVPRSAVSL